MGVRPLYFLYRPGAFVVFASLLGGVIAAGMERHRINPRMIAKIATSNFAHGTETQFSGIERVQPSETVVLTPQGCERRTNWRLVCRDPIPPSADRRAVMSEMRDKLDKAVRRRLPDQGPVFTHLSGGLDSTAIAALAARAAAERGETVKGYAFGPRPLPPDIPVIDEWPSIDAVLAQYPNIDLKVIRSPGHEMLGRTAMHPVFPLFDDPDDLYEQVIRDAVASGATTLLNGLGGDEVVSYAGAGGFAEMLVKLRWRNLWHVTRAVERRTGRPAWRIVLSEFQRYVLPSLLPFGAKHSLGRTQGAIEALSRFLKPAYRDAAISDDPVGRPDMAWMRATRVSFGHVGWIQERVAQIAGRHGLRYSSPLLDSELMEFAIRLPPEFLHVDGLMRAGLREPMAEILPDETRLRLTKLHYDPAAAHVFVSDIATVRMAIEDLRGTPAEEIFDIDVMLDSLKDAPSPDEVMQRIADAAAEGAQCFIPEFAIAQPLMLGQFIVAAEAALSDPS